MWNLHKQITLRVYESVIINRPLKAGNLWEGLRWLRAEKTPNGETAARARSHKAARNIIIVN